MKQPVKKALLALGLAGALATSLATAPTARAQLPTTYTQGDFLMGFRQVGNANSVVVDLGPIASFSSPLVFNINLGATLAAQYGAGWASDANVFSSLAATSSGSTTNFISSPSYLTGPNAGPARVWTRLTNGNSLSLQNKINNLGNEFTSAGRVQPNTDANAYAKFMPGGSTDSGHANGNLAWGFFNPTSEINFGQTTAGAQLDLIQLIPGAGAGTDLGSFRLSADGNTLTYTPAVVPEPTTYAVLALGALLLLGWHLHRARRSSTSTTEQAA